MTVPDGLNLIEVTGGCAACEELAPVVKSVADALGLGFVRIEYADLGKLLADWQVERIPATLLCDGGRAICKCYGYQPEEILRLYIEDKLEKYIKEEKYAV